jgi:hypothetical protein
LFRDKQELKDHCRAEHMADVFTDAANAVDSNKYPDIVQLQYLRPSVAIIQGKI